jgi:hypothetical protein
MGIFLGDVLIIEDNFKLLTLSIKTKIHLVSGGVAYLGKGQQVLVYAEAWGTSSDELDRSQQNKIEAAHYAVISRK